MLPGFCLPGACEGRPNRPPHLGLLLKLGLVGPRQVMCDDGSPLLQGAEDHDGREYGDAAEHVQQQAKCLAIQRVAKECGSLSKLGNQRRASGRFCPGYSDLLLRSDRRQPLSN